MDGIVVEKAREIVEQKGDNIEQWVSRSFVEHTIIVLVDENPVSVQFTDYALTLDLSNEADRKISEGLHKCGREGRDIFVLGPAYEENEIGDKAAMLKVLRGMDIHQLRALVTLDDMMSGGIPPNTDDPDELITLIISLKSIRQ